MYQEQEEKKQCTQCQEWLPLTKEYFHKGDSRGGFKAKCKQCCKENAKVYNDGHHEEVLAQKQKYRDAHRKEKQPKVIIVDGQRQCTVCKEWLPHTTEYFHRAPNDHNGLKARCKRCVSEQQTSDETKFRRKMNEQGLKQCIRCKEWKPMTREFFHLDRGEFISHCKPCVRERRREQTPTEQQLITARARRQRWIDAHPEKYKEVARNARVRSRDKRLASTRNYRAKKRAAHGTHTKQDIHTIYIRQKRRCYYCGRHVLPPGIGERKGEKRSYQVDHIVPLSRGGSNDTSNLVITCATCNESKGDKLLHEWSKGGRLL